VWRYELGACIVALAALVAIVATLYTYRGRPLPQLPFGISINALISIYVVLMEGSLVTVMATGLGQLKWTWLESDRPLYDLEIFDQASRGSWGCLYLLWHIHFRQTVASLGAILTVAILASDPFTQQMIHYVGCSELMSNEPATVPRALYYENDGIHTGALESSVNTRVQSSINSGLFANGYQVKALCPSGNCTFEQEYGSVGYCSSCMDISHSVEIQSACYNISSSSFEELPCSSELSRNLTSSLQPKAMR